MHFIPDKLHSFGRLAGLVVPVSDHLKVLVLDHVECMINSAKMVFLYLPALISDHTVLII